MKYFSIDIETTGLNPEKHQVLEFAAVFDDLEALVLLRQMRVASAELGILIQQNAHASERLRHKDRAVQVRSVATLAAVRADLDAAISRWEKKLGSVGDDAQLANIDLQTMLRKQQQTLQTISNVSKMLHDTAMAIIRKIG